MSNNEWSIANCLRLGLALPIIPHNFKCICSGKPQISKLGDHFWSCKHGNERMATHNSITTELHSFCRSAGLSGKVEPLLDRSVNNRRADLILFNPNLRFNKELHALSNLTTNVDVLFDIKVSFPCADSYIAMGSHRHPAITCNDAHKNKMKKYHDTPEDLLQGRGFLPISIESFGRFHSSIKPLIGAISEKASAISGISSSILINYWTNRISAVLQIHLARMMLARVDRILNSTVTIFSATSKSYQNLPSAADI